MDVRQTQQPGLEKLTPPVSKTNPFRTSATTHPAIIFSEDQFLRPKIDPFTHLSRELRTPRLNDIHQHLWLAGLPHAARPLHRQKLIGRNILVTEDPDEHLVWLETHIFIKPLPEFLLDWNYWNENLCSDQELHKSASGLLLSYAWLVRHKSDLDIAKETGLLPKSVDWPDWVGFLEAFLDNIDLQTLSDVNDRYHYGELRLSRLNAIYRLVPPVFSLGNFIRGYRSGPTWYKAFFERHFKWLLAIFAILSIFLSALQVGLSTTTLQSNGPFQRVSYGFTVASLVTIMTSIAIVFSTWLGLFWYYLLSTWQYSKAVSHRRGTAVPIP